MSSRTQRMSPKLLGVVTAKLEQAVRDYQETGVFYAIDDASNGWRNRHPPLLYPYTMRKFMRAIAKEEKRPFIMAQQTIYHTDKRQVGLSLIVPRRNKFEPLVAPLLVGAVPGPRYGYTNSTPSITYVPDQKTIWQFHFNDEQGRELFAHWYEQCRVNPDFKRILNTHLPEEVTPCSSSPSNSSSKSRKKPSLVSATA